MNRTPESSLVMRALRFAHRELCRSTLHNARHGRRSSDAEADAGRSASARCENETVSARVQYGRARE